VPKPEDSQAIVTLEPSRHRLIVERLQDRFYDRPEPSLRIANAVHAALHQADQGPAHQL
jgi:hypothetical protein